MVNLDTFNLFLLYLKNNPLIAMLIVSVTLNLVLIPLVGFVFVFGRPALAYAKAKLKGKDLLAVFMGNGRFKLIPSNYKILEVLKDKAWIPKNKKFWNWAGVQVVPVYDGWGITYDPEIAMAIEELMKRGINGIEELKERILQTESVINELKELYGQSEKTDENKIAELEEWLERYGISREDPVVYKAFGVIPVKEIENYFTDMYPSEVKAHIDENLVELAQQYTNPVAKIGAYVVYFVMVVIGGGIGIYLIKAAFGG